MKQPFSYLLATAAAAAVFWLAQPTPLPAQGQVDDPEMAKLVAEVIAQQALIVENHTKIDAKLAIIAEDVRQARLFAARGGNK